MLTLHNKKNTDMKGRSLTIIGIFAAAVAAVLILSYKSISITGITITCGILFVAVGLVNMIFFGYKSKEESSKVLTLISNAAAIVLGLSMLVFRDEFSPMIAFMLGLLVAVCSLWQFFVLAIGARPHQLPAWLYLFPVILACGALFIYLKPDYGDQNDSVLLLATGISMAVLGLGCILEGSILGVARRKDEKAQAQMSTEATGTPDRSEPQLPGIADAPRKDDSYSEAQPYGFDPESSRKKPETTEDLDDEIVDSPKDER